MTQRKYIPEVDKEWSDISYKWRRVLPKERNRPPSPVQTEYKEEILNELLDRSNKFINDVIKETKLDATGHAKLITTDKIVIDPRVRWKCRIPICFGYGMTLNCPPHSPTAEDMREIVSCYKHAILVTVYPPVKNHVFPSILTGVHGDVDTVNKMVSLIEAEATYLGYYLAMGFKGGPCLGCGFLSPEYIKDLMGQKQLPACPALKGEMCRQYLRARPALEACGVDVFATIMKCGEKPPYVINPEHSEKGVPYVGWHGIVLVV